MTYDIIILIQIDASSVLRVVLQIPQEKFIILSFANILPIFFLLLLANMFFSLSFHVLGLFLLLRALVVIYFLVHFHVSILIFLESIFIMLELPDSILLAFSLFRESLFDQNDIRQVLVSLLVLFDSARVSLREVVSEHCVIEVQYFSQMGLHHDGLVVFTEVLLSLDLYIDLSKSLSEGRSALVHIVVNIFDADDDEL